jgi:sugar lactone lactonase YvrE
MTDGNKFTCCKGNILVETKIINVPVEKRFSCFLFVGKNERTLEICNGNDKKLTCVISTEYFSNQLLQICWCSEICKINLKHLKYKISKSQ